MTLQVVTTQAVDLLLTGMRSARCGGHKLQEAQAVPASAVALEGRQVPEPSDLVDGFHGVYGVASDFLITDLRNGNELLTRMEKLVLGLSTFAALNRNQKPGQGVNEIQHAADYIENVYKFYADDHKAALPWDDIANVALGVIKDFELNNRHYRGKEFQAPFELTHGRHFNNAQRLLFKRLCELSERSKSPWMEKIVSNKDMWFDCCPPDDREKIGVILLSAYAAHQLFRKENTPEQLAREVLEAFWKARPHDPTNAEMPWAVTVAKTLEAVDANAECGLQTDIGVYSTAIHDATKNHVWGQDASKYARITDPRSQNSDLNYNLLLMLFAALAGKNRFEVGPGESIVATNPVITDPILAAQEYLQSSNGNYYGGPPLQDDAFRFRQEAAFGIFASYEGKAGSGPSSLTLPAHFASAVEASELSGSQSSKVLQAAAAYAAWQAGISDEQKLAE